MTQLEALFVQPAYTVYKVARYGDEDRVPFTIFGLDAVINFSEVLLKNGYDVHVEFDTPQEIEDAPDQLFYDETIRPKDAAHECFCGNCSCNQPKQDALEDGHFCQGEGCGYCGKRG